MPRQRPSAADRTTPYLESLDSSASGEVVALEWARYLVDAFGTAGAVQALQHYEDVGWISPAVRRAMMGHLDARPHDESGDDGDLPDALASLAGSPFEKHARSLAYVAAIADDGLPAGRRPVRHGTPGRDAGTGDATGTVVAAGEATADATDAATEATADATDAATEATSDDAQVTERVGVAGSVETAGTFHLLAEDGTRSRCGMLDDDSETAHDVAAVLPREDAEAKLSLCGTCRESAGEEGS